jgi:hypothetical protein
MTLSAPAMDRPVMSATYELVPASAGRPDPAHWMARLRARFGRTDEEGARDRRNSSSVDYWARWRGPTIEIGLSIYGAVRRVRFGRSAGLAYVTWTDRAAAAAPYAGQWRAATAALAGSAATLTAFHRFDVPEPLRAAGASIEPKVASFDDWRALNCPTLLGTPASISRRLSTRSFALWRSGIDGLWAVSTQHDTIVLRSGAHASWTELEPAKGAGCSGLSVGAWSITQPHGTPAIAEAAAALEALPGVVVEKYKDYDA